MFQAGSHSNPPTPNSVTITVSPGTATIVAGSSQQFTADIRNTTNTAATWWASAGKISSTGLFTAPLVSTNTTVVVSAYSQADSTKQAAAKITVTPSGTPFVVQTSVLPNGTTGTPYLEPVIASGGEAPYDWTLTSGALPSGIQLDPSSGALNGTPKASGSFAFGVTATDAHSNTAVRQLTLVVEAQPVPLSVQTSVLPGGTAGAAYHGTLSASGGQAPYQWNISSGALPQGMTLTAASGAISGTPSSSGSFSFTVMAADSASHTATRQLTLSIAPQQNPLAIQTSSLPDATAGTAYVGTLAATGGQAPYQWTVTAGTLPQGIQLEASNGTISGTTNLYGSFSFTVSATDSSSHTASRQLTLVALSGTYNLDTIPSTFFGLQSRATGGTYPTVNFGSYRMWDTDVAWASLNPSAGVYSWASVDGILAQLKSNGVSDGVLYTFGEVPNWASSAPSDAACDLGALGGCDLPADLNPDGTGTDQTFINFVKSLAQHLNSATYLQTHAHVQYWEPWNEWYRDPLLASYNQGCIAKQSCSVRATYAQMVRMTEDLRCVLTGTGSVDGVPCTRTAIDPTAKIVTPASHGRSSFGVSVMENFLHCDSAPPATSQCTTGDRGRNAVDILNFHFYAMETETAEEITSHITNIKAGLRSSDLTAMPLWSSEGGWGADSSLPDPDLQEAFLVRYYLLGWSNGISRLTWYEFDNPTWGTLYVPGKDGGLTSAGTAYQQIYNWMAGNALTQACSGPTFPAQGIWTCGFTKPDGTHMLAVWDSSQSCSNGACTTSLYSHNSMYSSYISLSTGKASNLTSATVPVGAKPILLIQ
ncbi:MAG TPA: Ig domain-containing protein [Verrucomicrobiae bacterium]|nr:Ig domain-containing protein [Verrucomicrobiae bacterium]